MDALLYNAIDLNKLGSSGDLERYMKSRQESSGVNKDSDGQEFADLWEQKIQDYQKLKNNEHGYNLSSSRIHYGASRQEVLEHVGEIPERKKLYQAAIEFESFFVEKMFKEMKKNVGKGDLFHGGFAEEIFDDLLTTERVKALSAKTEFGLAEKMYQQLQNL